MLNKIEFTAVLTFFYDLAMKKLDDRLVSSNIWLQHQMVNRWRVHVPCITIRSVLPDLVVILLSQTR